MSLARTNEEHKPRPFPIATKLCFARARDNGDRVAGQKPAIYRESLTRIAAALRAEADEIEILANERPNT